MAGNELHVITERKKLLVDRTDQRVVVPTRKIGAADGALKQYITDLSQTAGRMEKDNVPRRVSRAVQHIQLDIAELVAVRGIGRWTAEMFLIFNQMRPDVFPLDDIGLQRAVFLRYFDGEKQPRRVLAEFGERWRPWRSVATWYLWRSLDPVPVEY